MTDSKSRSIPVVLTIAGSDSGGSAGIQADLKTFSMLKVFGTSAVTCITAQCPAGIKDVLPVDPRMVALQIKTVCEAFPVTAVKTGMLYSAEIIEVVSRAAGEFGWNKLVVDPVMSSTSGSRLLLDNALVELEKKLFPKAALITPNVPEAEVLCGHAISTVEDMKVAAQELSRKYSVACVIKGGHLGEGSDAKRDKDVVNVLFDGRELFLVHLPRQDSSGIHGTGCTFSAALTAFLGRGESIKDAVLHASQFVAESIAGRVQIGKHRALWL